MKASALKLAEAFPFCQDICLFMRDCLSFYHISEGPPAPFKLFCIA